MVGPEAFAAVVACREVADECAGLVVDLRGITEDQLALAFDGGLDLREHGAERLVSLLGGFAQGFKIGGGAGVCGGVGEVLVEGRRDG